MPPFPEPQPIRYRCAPGIGWVVQTTGLTLVRQGEGVVAELGYPEAAVWDLASRGYRFDRLVFVIRHVAGLDEEAARRLVLETLQGWVRAGLLVRGE